MDKKEDEMKERLDDLTDIIKKVYLPLMQNRPDQRLHMDQFVRNVYNSMEQAYGNITIVVPNLPDKSNAELQQDEAFIEDLIHTVVSTLLPFICISSSIQSTFRFHSPRGLADRAHAHDFHDSIFKFTNPIFKSFHLNKL